MTVTGGVTEGDDELPPQEINSADKAATDELLIKDLIILKSA